MKERMGRRKECHVESLRWIEATHEQIEAASRCNSDNRTAGVWWQLRGKRGGGLGDTVQLIYVAALLRTSGRRLNWAASHCDGSTPFHIFNYILIQKSTLYIASARE